MQLGIPSHAVAEDAASEVAVEAQTGPLYFHYTEKTSRDLRITESGWLGALQLGLTARQNEYFSQLAVGMAAGTLNYDGYTQAGSSLQTNSYATLYQADIEVGRWLSTGGHSVWGFSAGTGYRLWDRAIQSKGDSIGPREWYQWQYLHASLLAQSRLGQQDGLLFQLRLINPVNSTIDIDLKQGFDQTRLQLSTLPSAQLSLTWQRQFRPDLSWQVKVRTEFWRVTDSQQKELTRRGQPTGLSVSEPQSFTAQFQLSGGIHWQ